MAGNSSPRSSSSASSAPSALGRILRTIAWAILIAFTFGFFIGTLLRRELERPVRYIGGTERSESLCGGGAVHPSDVGHTLPGVLMSRDHKEQVG